MFKKLITYLISFILIFTIFGNNNIFAEEKLPVNIYYFENTHCPVCTETQKYLDELEADYDNVSVFKYDISNPAAKILLNKVKLAFNEEIGAVPFTVVGGKHYVGFNENVKFYLKSYVEKYSFTYQVDVVGKILNNEEIVEGDIDTSEDIEYEIPFLGRINVKNVSLLLISVVIGLIDGFNPCAMWVLIFLITMLLATKDRKKMWILGGVFLFTSAAIYFLMMIAWLEVVQIVANKFWFQLFIGLFAIGAGTFQLIKFIKSTKNKEVGCEVTNEKQKKKLFTKIKDVVLEKKLFFAILGIIVIAISVNFIELACSAGLPVLFSQILLINEVSRATAIMYTLIYIFFFLLDDIIIFTIAMFTLKVTGISNKYSKVSSLVGGIIMLLIGILMIFFPDIIMFNF